MRYELGRPGRKCFASGRDLRAGDEFYSVLLETVTGWERREYALEHWPGPPADAVGVWRGRVPAEDARPAAPAPLTTEALLAWFDRLALAADEQQQRLRYVLTLLLLRRKALKLQDVDRTEAGEFLIVKRTRGASTDRVLDPRLSEERIQAVEQELNRLLEMAGSVREGQ